MISWKIFTLFKGGRIDHAHHRTFANIALDETLALDKAVQTAMETLKSHFLDEETLVIVTADHSHTMVLPGKIDLIVIIIFILLFCLAFPKSTYTFAELSTRLYWKGHSISWIPW